MRISGNSSFSNIYKLFDDIENKYHIIINDIEKRKMVVDICNLINREVLGLDELETYIIRCIYGIYNKNIGSSYKDIGIILGCNENKIKVYYIKSLDKIYEYILKKRKVMIYGDDSIYSLDSISYFILEKLESRNLLYIDDLLNMDNFALLELFKEFRNYLIPIFDDEVANSKAKADMVNFFSEINNLGFDNKHIVKVLSGLNSR